MNDRQPFLVTFLLVFVANFLVWTTWNRRFYGDVTLIEMTALAVPLTLFVRGFAARGARTSKSVIFLRACIFVFIANMILASLWNAALGKQFWTPLHMVVATLLIVCLHGGLVWLIVHLTTVTFLSENPDYQAMRDSGYDPYFDSLPPPINPDSPLTRQTGLPEPDEGEQW